MTTGCTHGYRVSVNGYSQLSEPFEPNEAFYVSANDPNSLNPIFDNQIKSKIETLLKRNNYSVVDNKNDSKYVISFHIGSNTTQNFNYEPRYHTYFGYHSGYWSGYDFGYATYVPYYDTYYNKWFSLKVTLRSDDPNDSDNKAVWVGESAVSSSTDDMRKIIDYLLTGCFRYFGADTTRKRTFVLSEDDSVILDLKYVH